MRRRIRKLHGVRPCAPAALAVVSLFLLASEPSASLIGRSLRLFDGKTFRGWDGNLKVFRIERGAIVAGTLKEAIPRNEFLCSKGEYRNFVLRLRFKVLGSKANAGVQFRTRRIPGHHEVIGYQADLGDGWWGSLYDESRRRRVLAAADASLIQRILRPNDWNDYVIRAEGARIRLSINGYQTVDYTEEDSNIEQVGRICLQIHGGPPSEAWYRDLLLELLR